MKVKHHGCLLIWVSEALQTQYHQNYEKMHYDSIQCAWVYSNGLLTAVSLLFHYTQFSSQFSYVSSESYELLLSR